jgi:hypothetical protein
MVQSMLLKTYLSYSTWYTILGMHINASDRHSQLQRILSNPSLPHENYIKISCFYKNKYSYTFSFLFETFLTSFENKVYDCKRRITPLRHAEKQWKTSMTFNDHKLACNANRYRMRRRCHAKKFLGKATSLKKLLSPAINLLLSGWYRYGPGKKCMDEICSEIMYVYHILNIYVCMYIYV